jgi:hypothetical protein
MGGGEYATCHDFRQSTYWFSYFIFIYRGHSLSTGAKVDWTWDASESPAQETPLPILDKSELGFDHFGWP